MNAMGDNYISTLRRALSGSTPKEKFDQSRVRASVIILLFKKDGYDHVLLNIRSDTVAQHKGEIAFPGGVFNDEDTVFIQTALREVHEEIGMKSEKIRVIGQLDDVRTHTSNFMISVFVGEIQYPYCLCLNQLEVADVLEVPIKQLFDDNSIREEIRWIDSIPQKRYSYGVGQYLIHGATANMIRQLQEVYLYSDVEMKS